MQTTATNVSPPAKAKMLAGMIGFAVLFLAAANGIFTYSGALLYVEHWLYALLFAIAVQMAISVTLLSLPYVRGLGRLALLTVYAAALTLSTLSAFTYIYNASQPAAGDDLYAVDVEAKTRISDALGQAEQIEQRHMDAQELALSRLQQAASEEQARGLRSGKGPGRGSQYVRKLAAYEDAAVAMVAPRRNFEQAKVLYQELNKRLGEAVSINQRQEIAARIAAIRVLTNSPEASALLSHISQNELASLRNPVERAMLPLLDTSNYSLTLLVSLVWAGIFDLLALFLGIIRYYLLRPYYSLMNGLYNGLVNMVTFFLRMRHAGSEARLQYRNHHSPHSREMPINSPEMQMFATALMAGSELSVAADGDVTEPLRTLVGYIEPLDLENDENGVGILHARVEEESRLKPLMAMLLQHSVFLNRKDAQCYLLNSSGEMAHKVLVFLRMGMKGQGALPFGRPFTQELPAAT
jgi:hypothetical protein